MSKVGTYKGVKWQQQRLCDVFSHLNLKSLWYFTLDNDGEYTGDHFKTLKELYDGVDNRKD